MTITAKLILASIADGSPQLTTLQLRYPKFIHGELMTHRVFSRNASSSRAVPVKRLIEDIRRDTAMPSYWGSNKPGMQAGEEIDTAISYQAGQLGGALTREEAWYTGRDQAIALAEAFDAAGYHKQIVNRIIEPYSHINVLVTSCRWQNFFALRCHKDAMPEMRLLAETVHHEITNAKPQVLKLGEWHLPFTLDHERKNLKWLVLKKISTARCARVSYLTHDQKEPVIENDLELHDRLVASKPLHASPAEHVCTPDRARPELHANTPGWIQYRKTLPNEFVEG